MAAAYTVVTANDLDQLRELVEQHLREEWQLVGSASYGETDQGRAWYQTLLHTDLGEKQYQMMTFQPTSLTETQRLAEAARQGLRIVAAGEDKTLEGWLVYGAALNEARAQFKSDEKFGRWVKGNLPDTEQKEREAAMWAAEDEPSFWAFSRLHSRVRTVRGLHAKWKEAQRPEPKAAKPAPEEPSEADLRRMESLRSTVNHTTTKTPLGAAALKNRALFNKAVYMAKEDGGAL